MNVEQFLYHEARLLDTQQYEAWLELFTEDATYWVPLEREQKDPFETSSIIHDDRTLLGLRVKQARHPRAHARLPLARTVHQVGNILVPKEDEPELLVASTLTLVEFRTERQRVWGALVEHRLRGVRGARFRAAADRHLARNGRPGVPRDRMGRLESLRKCFPVRAFLRRASGSLRPHKTQCCKKCIACFRHLRPAASSAQRA